MFVIQSCDLWTSLCHPMPGIIQKGLGRQRDAQSSYKLLTSRIIIHRTFAESEVMLRCVAHLSVCQLESYINRNLFIGLITL